MKSMSNLQIKLSLGFEHSLLTVAFFHTLDWHNFQVSKLMAWNMKFLGHQIQEASSTKFDHPQVIAVLVNSGDALVKPLCFKFV